MQGTVEEHGSLHPTRVRILAHLEQRPGQNLRMICDGLDLNRGTATHHLRRLEADGHLSSVEVGRERRFFKRRTGEGHRAVV